MMGKSLHTWFFFGILSVVALVASADEALSPLDEEFLVAKEMDDNAESNSYYDLGKRAKSSLGHALRIRRGNGFSHALRVRSSGFGHALRIKKGGNMFNHALRVRSTGPMYKHALRIKKNQIMTRAYPYAHALRVRRSEFEQPQFYYGDDDYVMFDDDDDMDVKRASSFAHVLRVR